jgi:hypothetical protein
MPDANRRPNRRKMRLVAAVCAAAAMLAGCGEREETIPAPAPAAPEAMPDDRPTSDERDGRPPRGEPTEPAETPPGDPRSTELEQAAARAVGDYLEALDAGDGARACGLLVPGALQELELPEPRGGCAASLTASIGYRDPRGLPVWEGVEARRIRVTELDRGGRSARVVATVETTFADRDEPSIEDDLVYLSRGDGRWLVAKPSSTLYRAVGIADIPPSVIAPPPA